MRVFAEMLEFLLHTQGYDYPTLYQVAPKGATVINPKTRPVHWSRRHMHEIRQRFPQSHYRQYPQYSKPAFGAVGWNIARLGTSKLPYVAGAVLGYMILDAIPASQPGSYMYDQRQKTAASLFRPQH